MHGDWEVALIELPIDKEKSDLMLEVRRTIEPKEVWVEGETQDKDGLFLEKRMRPYKEVLAEIANAVEGYFAIAYGVPPPKFESDRIMVNVHCENEEEEKLLKEGKITGGFGAIMQPPKRFNFQLGTDASHLMTVSLDHEPAMSFVAQAMRSMDENNQEIAFFLFFRIIDGYFSDGAKDVEASLISSEKELAKFLRDTPQLKESLKKSLTELGLQSHCHEDFEGLIKDLVLLRHKLTHFSETNAERHHKASVIFELRHINLELRRTCALILRAKVGIDK